MSRWWTENRRTLALAVPMMAGQLGQMLMALTDSVMVGRLGTVPLAAVAFANGVLGVGLVAGFGLVSGVGVLAAQAHGAGRRRDVAEALRHGLALGAAAGALLAALAWVWVFLGGPTAAGQPAEVAAAARNFLLILAASLPAALIWQVLKTWCEALSRPWPPLVFTAGAVGLNAVLNWAFIHGRLGLPALGLTGSAWATFAARMILAATLATYVWWRWSETARSPGPTPEPLPDADADADADAGGWSAARGWALLALGLPTGAAWLCEAGLFGAAALMMGRLGATALAAHGIALNCAATTFMLPLGLAMAVGVRLGQAAGAGADRATRRTIGFGGLGMATAMMTLAAGVFLLAGRPLARGFVGSGPTEEATVALAAGLLAVAGIFQVADGVQVVGAGALRGLGDVRVPTLIALAAYWGIALPACWLFGFALDGGPRGVWVGLALGLGCAAAALTLRLRRRLR